MLPGRFGAANISETSYENRSISHAKSPMQSAR
jgi:hypothetical protein